MSDPVPLPGHRQPPRAEALQPDAPARGTDREDAGADPAAADAEDPADAAARHAGEEAARAQAEQTRQALENVRDGYA